MTLVGWLMERIAPRPMRRSPWPDPPACGVCRSRAFMTIPGGYPGEGEWLCSRHFNEWERAWLFPEI
jgi:hypothetical protein